MTRWRPAICLLLWTAGAVLAQPASPEAAVRANLDAFNRHDVEALVATVAPDFAWFNIDGEKLLPDTRGRDALRKGMAAYFKSQPSVRSGFESLTVNGAFVSVKERASWNNKVGEPRSQVALAVYEVRDGLILRVWYFPAEK